MVFNTGRYTDLPDNSILIAANMQSETGFPSRHQLKSYVASKSRLKLAARAVSSADAGLLVHSSIRRLCLYTCWLAATFLLFLNNLTREKLLSLVQYNETADYVHRCFNGTLVQATALNKQVPDSTVSSPRLSAIEYCRHGLE